MRASIVPMFGRLAVACLAFVVLPACLSDRPLRNRLGFKSDRADDAVGFVSVSTPLFTPLDEPLRGPKRLDFNQLTCWDKLTLDLATPSFGINKTSYDLFTLALAANLTTINQKIVERTVTPVDSDAAPTTQAPPTEDLDGAAPNTRSVTRTFESASTPNAATIPTLPPEIKELMAGLLEIPERNLVLPPDTLITLAASLRTYMTNLEEVYNVDGFDYRHGLSGRYVPYKAHFTVTAEPGWFSRYRKYDAVIDVALSLLEDKVEAELGECCSDPSSTCDNEDCDDLIILHVSPLETAQSITEFAAALAEFGAAVQAQGSASSDLAFNAQAQRLSAAAQRLEGARAHKTFVVGFPASNRMRIRFIADRAATDTGRDLQPKSLVLTATVLVPAAAAGRLNARVKKASSDEQIRNYRQLMVSKRSRDRANAQIRDSLAASLRGLQAAIAQYHNEATSGSDPFLEAVFAQAATAVALGEDPDVVLHPLMALLHQEVPRQMSQSTRAALLKALGRTDKRGTPSANPSAREPRYLDALPWKGLFARFALADAKQVTQAFQKAAGTEVDGDFGNSDFVTQLALDIKDVGREDFGVTAERLNAALTLPIHRRSWIAAHTFQVVYRLFLMQIAMDGMQSRINKRAQEQQDDLALERLCVEKLLRGSRCAVDVKAYFAPTMFGPSGEVSPPREHLFGIVDPPDKRVLAADLEAPRVAPIPPWMGPLSDEVEILTAVGTFHAVLGTKAQYPDWVSAEAALATAQEELATTTADTKSNETAKNDKQKAVDAAQAKLTAARLAASRAALADGTALVRVRYAAPPMILDPQESLIHLTDVYARVVGLGPVRCRAVECGEGPTGSCAAGGFCRLLPGTHEALIEVRGVDLSVVVAADATDLTAASSLRAVLEVIVVPKGVEPSAAWVGGTAQIATARVQLDRQAAGLPVAATPVTPACKTTLCDPVPVTPPKDADKPEN